MTGFFGQYAVNLDAQNRIVVPVRLRDALLKHKKESLYISPGIEEKEKYLTIYPSKLWEGIASQIRMFRNIEDETFADRRLKKHFFGSTHSLEVDNNGRALLPNDLRSYANLNKKIVLIGMQEVIEIWDEEKWLKTTKDDNLHSLLEKGARKGIRLY